MNQPRQARQHRIEWPDVAPEDFTLRTVPGLLAEYGDPHADMHREQGGCEQALEWYEQDGLGEMPYPPDHPKMPGEPPRVQPSRKNPANWPKAE